MESGYLIGIDVGGTNLKLMIMDETLRMIAKRSIPTNGAVKEAGYEQAAERMIDALEGMFANAGIETPKVLHLAMGLPGMVDASGGKTLSLPYLEWDGFNPAARIASHFDAPCSIENDANVNALGELYFGEHSAPNMILVTLGTGVGGGILSNGRIFGGAHNYGGEIGHMMIVADEGRSFCGRSGCLEAYCSGSAMADYAAEEMEANAQTALHRLVAENGGVYDNVLLSRGCREQDPGCLRVMARFNHYLAVGLTNLIELFNPELILLGGGVSNAGELILRPVREEVQRRVLRTAQCCPIEQASLGSEAGMYGACALAAQKAGVGRR